MIDAFLGLYNREQSRRLPPGSLVVADNVDADDFGGIVLRNGYQSSLPMTSITSAFSTQDERRLFVVDGGNLKLITSDLSATTLASGLTSEYIHWLEVADFILMSTGHIIDTSNNVLSWRIPTPQQVVVTATTGNLPAGNYQIVCTHEDDSGREGGASPTVTVEVTNGGGLSISTDNVTGYQARVYVTDVNGTEFYYAGDGSNLTIISTQGLTSPIDKVQLRGNPAPDNTNQLAFYESRVWTAEFSGGQTVIWYSEPFWWNLFDLSNNHIIVPGKVTALVGIQQGLIIGTDDEIYVYTAEETLVRLAQYGVPDGVSYTKDDTGKLFMWTKQGLCSMLPFKNLTEDKVSLPPGNVCYTKLVEQSGRKKVVVLTDSQGYADNKL